VGDTHAGEDLVAEVFIAAMRSIRRYQRRGLPFRSWLYRIATNAVNRWSRKQRRAAWLGLIGGWPIHRTDGRPTNCRDGWPIHREAMGGAMEPSSDHSEARDGGIHREGGFTTIESETEVARRAMLTLPPHHQAVLALHYFEGLPLEEVAAICGCRLGTVKSRLARGRQSLRAKLERGR
jgi:RNA polymerase sigma factor (sigma-70 family)